MEIHVAKCGEISPSHTAARSSTKAVAPTAAACGWSLEQMEVMLHVYRRTTIHIYCKYINTMLY